MSSPNIIAAASLSKQRPDKAQDSSGFDAVHAALCNRLLVISPPTAKTVRALLNTSHKHLKSSFSDSIGTSRAKSKTPDSQPPSTPAPSVVSRTCVTRSTVAPQTAFQPSPVKFPSDDDVVLDTEDDDVMNIPRYDDRQTPLTSKNYGVRRLSIDEFIRLGCEDEFVLYIPPTSTKDAPEVKAMREDILMQMKRIVMSPFQKSTTTEERDAGWKKHLERRQYNRDGNPGYDFVVKVVSYPERSIMDRPSIPPSELKYLLNPVTKAGLTLELIGFGSAKSCHLKLLSIPFVEAYVPRKPDAPFLDDIAFTKSKDESKQVAFMAKELLACKGDPAATANVLLKYYSTSKNAELSSLKAENVTLNQQREDSDFDALKSRLKKEVSRERLDAFAADIDSYYKSALESTVQFSQVRSYLIADKALHGFYERFKSDFPSVHSTLYSIVSSRYFKDAVDSDSDNDDEDVDDEPSIHQKQRLLLYLFFASCRAKSTQLMKFWAMIDPLALFYKGMQQPRSKSLAGAFSCTLPTALEGLDLIFENKMPSFYALLEMQSVVIGAFDNYQKNIQKENQTEHKAAITHKGTAYFACEEEDVRWMGAYKLSGKNNYVQEGLRRMDTRYGPDMSLFDLENLRMNRFFLMTEGGHGMSMDEVNELLNEWFKKFLKSPSLQKNVESSKHVMSIRKCSYETFGYKDRKSGTRKEASQYKNVNKLIGLFVRTNLYPLQPQTRLFEQDFFWSHVQKPKSTGSEADKAKESVSLHAGKKRLFSVLCVPEEMRDDGFAEFENENELNDEDGCSIVSSRAGSVANDEECRAVNIDSDKDEDDDDDSVEMTEEGIESGLKMLGNVKRKRMSPLIRKDLLGVDGQVAMVGMKKKYAKDLAREKSQLFMMRVWNRHFDLKMEQRMAKLKRRQEESKDGTFKRFRFEWRSQYVKVIDERRCSVLERPELNKT